MKKLTFALAAAAGFAFVPSADAQWINQGAYYNSGYGGVTVIQPSYYPQSVFSPAIQYSRPASYLLNSYQPSYNSFRAANYGYNDYQSYNTFRSSNFYSPFGGQNYGYSSFYRGGRLNRW